MRARDPSSFAVADEAPAEGHPDGGAAPTGSPQGGETPTRKANGGAAFQDAITHPMAQLGAREAASEDVVVQPLAHMWGLAVVSINTPLSAAGPAIA